MNRGASWDTIRSSSALVEHKFETGQTFSYVQTDATTPNNLGSCWLTMLRRASARSLTFSAVPRF